MHKSNYELNVLVNGKPVREYYHDNRFFIEAKNGTEYSLKLKNHSHKKIMTVISVDGVDVLKGKAATEAESGYIINPYSSINIQGYRIDDNNVATFKFSDGKTSYATQIEQNFDEQKLEQVQKGEVAPARNNGVIGIRIWEEKEPKVIPEWKQASYSNKNSFYDSHDFNPIISAGMFLYSGCGPITGSFNFNANLNGRMQCVISGSSSPLIRSYSQGGLVNSICALIPEGPIGGEYVFSKGVIPNYTPSFELGTSWGKQQEDKVTKVTFQKADSYIDLEVYYLNREEMVKMGIDLENSKKIFVSGFPEAFGKKEEYCQQPKNWRNK